VNADTWATELGVLHRGRPRLLTTGRPVEPGTSGAISATGTAAALAGGALIGLAAAGFDLAAGAGPGAAVARLGVTALAGLGGSLADSLLGATVQAIYYCDRCCQETERHPRHRCGAPTRRLRGWPWLNNDWVNAIASGAGALLAAALWVAAA
jgi:uncharacterized membrane protein